MRTQIHIYVRMGVNPGGGEGHDPLNFSPVRPSPWRCQVSSVDPIFKPDWRHRLFSFNFKIKRKRQILLTFKIPRHAPPSNKLKIGGVRRPAYEGTQLT